MVETVLSVAVLRITVPGVTILSRAGVFGGVTSTTPTRSRVVIPIVARAFPRWCISAEPLAIIATEGLLRLTLSLPVLLSSFSTVLLNLDAAIHQSTQRVTLNTAKLQLDVRVKSLAVIVQLLLLRVHNIGDEDMTPMHMTMFGTWYGGVGG